LGYLEIYLTALKSYYAILDISDYQNAYVIKSQINHIWQDYEQEMKCYEKILELEPNNTTALYYMGMVCDTLGKAEEAVNYLEQLIKLDSMTHSKTEPLRYKLFYDIGKILCKLGRYQEALDYFDKSLTFDDNKEADSLAYYANTLSLLGKHQEAIEYFDKALSLDSNHTFSYINKARVLNHLKKYRESSECCDKGLAINPNDANFLALRKTTLSNLDIEDLIENAPLSLAAKNIALKEFSIIQSLNDNNVEKADHLKYLHRGSKKSYFRIFSIYNSF
jgi:tetratricopeptide (TPR) repeat protein